MRVLKTASYYAKTWLLQVRKMKAVFHCMNLFDLDSNDNYSVAYCWIPVCYIPEVYEITAKICVSKRNIVNYKQILFTETIRKIFCLITLKF